MLEKLHVQSQQDVEPLYPSSFPCALIPLVIDIHVSEGLCKWNESLNCTTTTNLHSHNIISYHFWHYISGPDKYSSPLNFFWLKGLKEGNFTPEWEERRWAEDGRMDWMRDRLEIGLSVSLWSVVGKALAIGPKQTTEVSHKLSGHFTRLGWGFPYPNTCRSLSVSVYDKSSCQTLCQNNAALLVGKHGSGSFLNH